MMEANSIPGFLGKQPHCLICSTPILETENSVQCDECHTKYHKECWEMNKGCAVYGCKQAPPGEAWTELEIPVSYWGKEHKKCPACNMEIYSTSLRCIHCGAVFTTRKPLRAIEYKENQYFQQEKNRIRKQLIWLFVLNLFFFTAVLAFPIGWFFYRKNKKFIALLSNFHLTLMRLGLFIGGGQLILIPLLSILVIIKK